MNITATIEEDIAQLDTLLLNAIRYVSMRIPFREVSPHHPDVVMARAREAIHLLAAQSGRRKKEREIARALVDDKVKEIEKLQEEVQRLKKVVENLNSPIPDVEDGDFPYTTKDVDAIERHRGQTYRRLRATVVSREQLAFVADRAIHRCTACEGPSPTCSDCKAAVRALEGK